MTRRTWLLVAACVVAGVRPGQAQAVVDESKIVCLECHADMDGPTATLVDDWRKSVHYEQGVSCGQCHGMKDTDFDAIPDPGEGKHTRPDVVRTLAVCKQCHSQIIEYYPLSAHFQEREISCLMCHGGGDSAHGVRRATLAIIQPDRCAKCHTFERAQEVKDAIQATDVAVEVLDAAVEELSEKGYHSTRLEKLVERGHELKKRAPYEMHTFQLRRIKDLSKTLTNMADHMREEEERILGKLAVEARRKKIGVFVMASCFFLSALILAFRQTYIDDWRAENGPPPDKL